MDANNLARKRFSASSGVGGDAGTRTEGAAGPGVCVEGAAGSGVCVEGAAGVCVEGAAGVCVEGATGVCVDLTFFDTGSWSSAADVVTCNVERLDRVPGMLRDMSCLCVRLEMKK